MARNGKKGANKFENSQTTIAGADGYCLTLEDYKRALDGDKRTVGKYGGNDDRAVFLFIFATNMTIFGTIVAMRSYDKERYGKIQHKAIEQWLNNKESLPNFIRLYEQLCQRAPRDIENALDLCKQEVIDRYVTRVSTYNDYIDDMTLRIAGFIEEFLNSNDDERRDTLDENVALLAKSISVCNSVIAQSGITRNNLTLKTEVIDSMNKRIYDGLGDIIYPDDENNQQSGDPGMQE